VKTFENAIQFLFDNTGLIWDKTVEHIWLSLASLGVAMLIAIPVGVWLGHMHRGSFVAINVSNIGRALPSLAKVAGRGPRETIGQNPGHKWLDGRPPAGQDQNRCR